MPPKINRNTRALSASLDSSFPTLRAEAERLIRDAREGSTQEDAARKLGTTVRALRRNLRTLEKLREGEGVRIVFATTSSYEGSSDIYMGERNARALRLTLAHYREAVGPCHVEVNGKPIRRPANFAKATAEWAFLV